MRVPMVVMKIALTVLVLYCGTAAAGDAPTGADKAAPGLKCHNATVGPQDPGAAVSAAQTQSSRSGDAPPPPGPRG